MHHTSYWGRVECARLLFEGGAEPKATNNKGHTHLDDAREVGSKDIVLLLTHKSEDDSNEL